ncbi:thioredoxin family protein [bacterium]|nr:thioredoxin family protein [bacterium]
MNRNILYLMVMVCVFVLFQLGCDANSSKAGNSPCQGDCTVKPEVKTTKSETVIAKLPRLVDLGLIAKLPRLVDLGRGTCIPCKMMTPILEELKKDYKDRVIVDYIDIGEKPEEAKKYGVRVIPTQILFDSAGKEVFRHEGFIPKKELITKFESIGVK